MQNSLYRGWNYYEKRKDLYSYLKKTESLNKAYLNDIPKDLDPILLHSEQGIGDQILYLSLLHEIIEWPNPILIQINSKLIPLFKRSFPDINFYSDKEILNPSLYKYHALFGSLPKFFRKSKDSFLSQKKSFLISDQKKHFLEKKFWKEINFFAVFLGKAKMKKSVNSKRYLK